MWFKYLLIGMYVLSSAITASNVGKDREPLSATVAFWTVIINALFIFGIIKYL